MEKCISVSTKYCGPTDTKGARISVSAFGKRRMYYWDDSLDVQMNHKLAMHAYIRDTRSVEADEVCVSYSETDRGYNFHIKVGM